MHHQQRQRKLGVPWSTLQQSLLRHRMQLYLWLQQDHHLKQLHKAAQQQQQPMWCRLQQCRAAGQQQ
jgi:hypothetical protein